MKPTTHKPTEIEIPMTPFGDIDRSGMATDHITALSRAELEAEFKKLPPIERRTSTQNSYGVAVKAALLLHEHIDHDAAFFFVDKDLQHWMKRAEELCAVACDAWTFEVTRTENISG
jgi:hypothetical protein